MGFLGFLMTIGWSLFNEFFGSASIGWGGFDRRPISIGCSEFHDMQGIGMERICACDDIG